MTEHVSFIEAFGKIKEAFSKFTHLQLADGFSKLASLGGDIIALGITGFAGFLIADVLQNENLKTRQKILPALAYGLGMFATIPLAISIIIGASVLIPPFIFAASCVSAVRSIGLYLEERAERKNLRKEMISTDDLIKKINKAKLSDDDKKMLEGYLKAWDPIYDMLYAARQDVITDGSLSVSKKREKVLAVNKIIEDFYLANQAEGEQRVSQLADIAKKVELAGLQTVSRKITEFSEIGQAFEKMNLPSSLRKSMYAYQFTHEKIFSQDLPGEIKQKYIQLIEGKKIAEDDLQLLYSHIGNRFINQTPLQQVAIQDDNFEDKLKATDLNKNAVEQCKRYYLESRQVYDELMKLREQLPTILFANNDREKVMELFESFRRSFIELRGGDVDKWIAFKNQIPDTVFLKEIEHAMQKLATSEIAFEAIKIDSNLKKMIQEYDHATMAQYANSYHAEFPAPKINFDFKANDLLHRSGLKPGIGAAFSKVTEGVSKISETIQENVIRKIAGEKTTEEMEGQELKQEKSAAKKAMRKDFKTRYAGVFNVVQKKERLNFLEKSVPRQLANVFMSIGVAAASLVTTILIPAVASPAAPVAAVAATVIGALSATLSVASIANSVGLVYEQIKGKIKLSKTKETVSSGVVPDFEYGKKAKEKYQTEMEKQNKKEAKQEAKMAAKEEKAKNAKELRANKTPFFNRFMNVQSEVKNNTQVKDKPSSQNRHSKP
ncbi:hypothetical protein [Candidatus Berkiella aquae]|uniref:Uncharacterized protein n=1 Tax=Candidatus Berkiella aquae TaxID=295108 RepID=A0A0Q9YVA2_9GAMM|nr:hypothetical protein [Candidatus Berkiella aquae]MCS5711345.1 hypothetical protein [Candidatus Berkiella aquae]